jgi:hypothetical protein
METRKRLNAPNTSELSLTKINGKRTVLHKHDSYTERNKVMRAYLFTDKGRTFTIADLCHKGKEKEYDRASQEILSSFTIRPIASTTISAQQKPEITGKLAWGDTLETIKQKYGTNLLELEFLKTTKDGTLNIDEYMGADESGVVSFFLIDNRLVIIKRHLRMTTLQYQEHIEALVKQYGKPKKSGNFVFAWQEGITDILAGYYATDKYAFVSFSNMRAYKTKIGLMP